MSSVGAYLRQLREARGVSLEEIARTTRVNSSYLHSLEADDLAALPAPVFTRGFIRAYCQAVGEAPDEALALYDGRSGAPASLPSSVGTPLTSATEPPRNRGPVLVSFVLLVILGVSLFAVTLALQSGRETPPEPRGVRPTASPPFGTEPLGASAPPAPVTPGASPPVPAATTRPGYRLVARTTEPTWVRVRTADGRTTEETIAAGQVREWSSPGPFTLTVGNAGGVAFELNGRALPPLGASGVVIPHLVLPTETQ
jgi:cytoskeletal protein RodZ